MVGYYRIVRLKKGEGIVLDDSGISINLDSIRPEDQIEDDESFIASQHPDYYTYLSGGGTVLINRRYLIAVHRGQEARVNPGRLSLFTGRANGFEEWVQPQLVVRELFEELLLLMDGHRLHPRCSGFQTVIDAVYAKAGCTNAAPFLELLQAPLVTGEIRISLGGNTLEPQKYFYHINSRNDINVLYLFEAELDMKRLTAIDQESDGHAGRQIVAIDLEEMKVKCLSDEGQARKSGDADEFPKTEHLEAMIEMAKIYIQSSDPAR